MSITMMPEFCMWCTEKTRVVDGECKKCGTSYGHDRTDARRKKTKNDLTLSRKDLKAVQGVHIPWGKL